MTRELALQALHAAYPAIKSFLSARIPDIDARDRVESLVAENHYLVGDADDRRYFSIQEYAVVLGSVECDQNVRVDHLLAAHHTTFDQIIESTVYELIASGGMQKHLLHDIFKSDAATQLFIGCAKSFLLACTLKQPKSHLDSTSIEEHLRAALLEALVTLEFLKRFQLDRIRQTFGHANNCIAFYCSDGMHRTRWTRFPSLLQRDGNAVLLLYGTAIGDALETQANAFYVGHGLIMYLDCVDLFVIENAVDGLPECSRKALIADDVNAPWLEQSNIQQRREAGPEASLLEQYRHAVATQGALVAYFRVYDYILTTSPQGLQAILNIANSYGLTIKSKNHITQDVRGELSVDFFNRALIGRALPAQIFVVPLDGQTGEVDLCEIIALMMRRESAESWYCIDNENLTLSASP